MSQLRNPDRSQNKKITVTEETLLKEGNRPIQVTTIPFQDSEGEWLVAEVNVDISDRKRTEDVLRKAHEELEIRVQERTAELARANEAMQAEITERKRAEEATQESEKRYRQVIENAVDIIYTTDANGNFTYANPASLTVTGYSLEELQRLNYLNLILPEHRNRVSKIHIGQFRQRQATTYVEFPFFSKSGGVLWFGQNASLVIEEGKPVGFHVIARDITERKRAEQALRESEKKYRTILETIQDGYFENDLAGNFTFVNDALCTDLGYSREELIGMNYRQYTDEKTAMELFRHYNMLYRTGEPIKLLEIERIGKYGKKSFAEVSTSLIRDLEGKPIGFRGISRDITERKQAEKALRKSEEKYRKVLEGIEEGYCEEDLAGNFTFFNDSMCRIYGYPREELLGLNYKRYTSKETAKRLFQIFNEIYRTGNPCNAYSYELIRKDGARRYIEASASLIKDSGNKPAGFRGIVRDVTQRKQMEEALHEREEQYRTLLETMKEGYYEVDLAGNLIFVNDSFSKMHARENMLGMNNREYMSEETARRVYKIFNGVYETGKPVRLVEWEITKGDGQKAVVEASVYLIKNSRGERIGFRGIERDITERKQAEEALRKSEEKYRNIIESIQDGYFEDDLAGNFTFVNDVICKHLGYTKEELIGMSYRQYADEENRRKLYERYNELYKTGQPIKPFEVEVIRRDGTKMIAEISASLMKNSEGKPVGFQGISRDVTERKEAEKERLSLQEQLRQSQKMEAIGQLAGGVAHDFNNLLTVIKGYSQLSLLDLKEDNPLRGSIQEIEKATQRATDLTRQLLAFSRRQILNPKVLDLNVLLKDLEKMLRRLIGEDIELVTLLSKDLGKVKVDPSQFEQVIFNLAVNARDAMPSGGKLTIETSNVELDEEYAHAHVSVVPGRYVRLSVSDTGVGMTQEVKEKVFEPFFTTKEKGKGTGLGLSMVYGIVKQSNGNIWLYSEPNRGTTFRIYFPRTEEEAETLHEREETDSFPRGSETVLLVEDEELVRDLATRLLEQQGYRVLKAANGQEALRVAKELVGETIHLLLADIVMPHMGGKELADWLKISRPNVKVLFTSGYADNAIVHHGVLDPGTHFLQKPFSLKTLSHKVREVLDG